MTAKEVIEILKQSNDLISSQQVKIKELEKEYKSKLNV